MPTLIQPANKLKRLRRKYGQDFPDPAKALPKREDAESPERLQQAGQQWRTWIDGVLQAQEQAASDMRMHWARHRLFRAGHQWISSRDGRSWRETGGRSNRIRQTFNLLGPAMDFRLMLLQEQRPGWRVQPVGGSGVQGRETAEAQQSVTEWYFQQQDIWQLVLWAASYAQTDGCCFLQVYLDKGAGPMVDRVRYVAPSDQGFADLERAGYEKRGGKLVLPLDEHGKVLDASGQPARKRRGEIKTKLVQAWQTYADPEALTLHGPDAAARWFIVQRPRALSVARLETGRPELEAEPGAAVTDLLDISGDAYAQWQRGLPPYPTHRLPEQSQLVWDHTLYLTPDGEDFPDGLWVRTVADSTLGHGKLPGGVLPFARITDGSPDSGLYPRPVASDWISDQMAVNAMGSKIMEIARAHSGARVLAMKDTLIEETWSNIVGSIIEYQGPKPDVLQPPGVSSDLWRLWNTMVQDLRDKTGDNMIARGKVGGNSEAGFQDVSGRAVLGAREMFERQFGPLIRATARGTTEWARVMHAYVKYLFRGDAEGFLVPKAGRPDLAKRITSEKIGDTPLVYIDEETLMPLPRALRNQMLFDHLQAGLIDLDEYRSRAPYAEIRNLSMGETDHWARAQWVNMVLEETWEELSNEDEPAVLWSSVYGLQVLWQDVPSVHMKALEELVLDEKQPWGLRKLAADRWGIYSDLKATKDHPPELQLQGIPAPPAPAEVIGVPPSVAQAAEESEQRTVPGSVSDALSGGPPGASATPGAMAAPEQSPVSAPRGSTMSAQPLGEYGMEA